MSQTYYEESYPGSLWGAGGAVAPTLTTLAPNTKVMGSGAFTLTCTGTGFLQGSYVLFDGAGMTTTYVNPTTLTVAVPSVAGPARTVQVSALVPAFPPTANKPFTITATQEDEPGGTAGTGTARTGPADSPSSPQGASKPSGGTGTAQKAPEAPEAS